MKPAFLTASAVVLSLLSIVPAHARETAVAESGRVGNGGYAYVCRDAGGAITLARLLDLWEAEGVPTWTKTDSVDAQLAAALERLKSFSMNAWSSVSSYVEPLKRDATYSTRALNSTEDAFPPYKPQPGCGYEQVAQYETAIPETGRSGLRIASEIFNSPFFSNSDRAALFFHEAAYFVDRLWNHATTSQRTRIAVAHLFSDSPIPNSVRLLTTVLLVGENRPTFLSGGNSEQKVPATMVAVPDPSAIRFTVRMETVDGADWRNSTRISAEKARARYRCEVIAPIFKKPAKKFDTGWVKLADLVEGNASIEGTFQSVSLSDGIPWTVGMQIDENLVLHCDRRGSDGRISAVDFKNAAFSIPDGNSLVLTADGSVLLNPGKYALKPFVSAIPAPHGTESRRYVGEFRPQIVRAAN